MKACGGLTDSKGSDAAVEGLVRTLKPQIEEKLGKSLSEISVHSYKTQVVAGTNFFVKIKTGEEEYAHLRIYKHFSGETTLHSVQPEKEEHEQIGYF